MTHKVAMTFIRGWGVYNAGEIAGFDADQAQALEAAGIAARAKDQPKSQTSIAALTIDFENSPAFQMARKSIEDAAAEVETRAAEVALRETAADRREAELLKLAADLEQRAEDLDAREAALPALGVAVDSATGEVSPVGETIDADGVVVEPVDPAPDAKSTGLPKQGR